MTKQEIANFLGGTIVPSKPSDRVEFERCADLFRDCFAEDFTQEAWALRRGLMWQSLRHMELEQIKERLRECIRECKGGFMPSPVDIRDKTWRYRWQKSHHLVPAHDINAPANV